MNTLRLWPILFLLVSVAGFGSTTHRITDRDGRWLPEHERLVFQNAVRDSQFADLSHYMARSRCEETQPPEALTTPDPLLMLDPNDEPVTVSFIVDADGAVESPLILQGGDASQDQVVLNAVRHWRYRPATCNGVPTESEAHIEFSHR